MLYADFREFVLQKLSDNSGEGLIWAPIICQEWLKASFRRPECHQVRALKSLLAIYQTVSTRSRVNKARDGKGLLPLTYSSMAAGQALVVPVVSPTVVINSYAIPDTVLTAAFLVMSYWP
jgi:hypothetical protein